MLVEPLPPRAHLGEHVLDHVLGGRLIPDQHDCEPDKLKVPGAEHVRDTRRILRRQLGGRPPGQGGGSVQDIGDALS